MGGIGQERQGVGPDAADYNDHRGAVVNTMA